MVGDLTTALPMPAHALLIITTMIDKMVKKREARNKENEDKKAFSMGDLEEMFKM